MCGRVGVYKKNDNAYVAHIKIDNKRRVKTFHIYEEAVKTREQWEREREEYYAERERQKIVFQKENHLCTENCRDCWYSTILKWDDGNMLACLYSLKTKRSRPCYAGDNCTVKEIKKS